MRFHLIALFTVFVWGTTFVSTKVLLVDFSPLWILLLRFALGFLVLCLLRPHILKMKERRHELMFVAAGFTGVAGYYLLENVALVFTTATSVGVIVAAAPLFTALLCALLGDRSALTWRFFAGFVVAMCGLVIVGVGSGTGGASVVLEPTAIFGDLLALAAALVWAVYSVLVKRIAEEGYETVAATKRTFLWGLVFMAPVTLVGGGALPLGEALTSGSMVLNLLFLGVVASAACFVTWGVSVKHLGAARSTAYIYLVPVITAGASVLVLGEPLNGLIVGGICLTIGGLILSQRR